jgi:hypothetical protein
LARDSAGWYFRVGLLVVSASWFLFTFYEFVKAAVHIGKMSFWVYLTDTAGAVGLGFRTVASLIAFLTLFFYVLGRDLSAPEATMSLRWIILGEAVCFLALFPSGVWGLSSPNVRFLLETGVPCIVESILLPAVLLRLFFELKPSSTARQAIKWALISGAAYIFVFWLNNTANWIFAVIVKGTEYLTAYPLNIFSFGLTVIGLFALTVYAAVFSWKQADKNHLSEIDAKKVGLIITLLGLYFDVIYVMWVLFGSVGGWGPWYQWFLGHNMDLWVMALPAAGVPLLFSRYAE